MNYRHHPTTPRTALALVVSALLAQAATGQTIKAGDEDPAMCALASPSQTTLSLRSNTDFRAELDIDAIEPNGRVGIDPPDDSSFRLDAATTKATGLLSLDGKFVRGARPSLGRASYTVVDARAVGETSHYFQHHFLRNDDYGKIGEPLANAQAVAIAGNEWFDKGPENRFENMDVQANYKNGAFQGAAWEMCDGCSDYDYSYGWTQRVLWDLIDGTSASEPEPLTSYIPEGGNSPQEFGQFDSDNGGGGHNQSTDADDHQLNDVLVHYLGGGVNGTASLDYVDRGLVHVDLVDVLDGMICKGYLSESAADALVNDAMGFGYDFGGPAVCDN